MPPVVTTGLQLYYDPVTYTGSGTLDDLSGNGFTATLYNVDTSNYASHYFNYNGTNSNLQTPNMVSAFNTTPAVSYEVWVWGLNDGCIVSETGTTALNSDWYDNQMEVGGVGGPPWSLYASTYPYPGAGFTPPSPPVQQATWYQMVLTYDGSTGTGYVNGVAGASATGYNRQAPWDYGSGYYLNFGASTPTYLYAGNFWYGAIGIVRAYNRGLTAEEVQQNFTATRGIYGI